MCKYSKRIFNPYIHRHLLVPCGKCPACQQEKANKRARRINNHKVQGECILFVTLTYKNEYIPYILRSDVNILRYDALDPIVSSVNDFDVSSSFHVPVYRNKRHRLFHGKEIYYDTERHVIDTIPFTKEEISNFDISSIRSVRKSSPNGVVGVCYFPDFQNFMKRLRINLFRDYGITNKLTYFVCSEYGPTTDRPHFHMLLFTPTPIIEAVRCSIIKSWAFADEGRTNRFIQIARNAAGYVASYVNCSNSRIVPFQKTAFRQTHSMSKGFGVRAKCFDLARIIDCDKKGVFTYDIKTMVDGTPCIRSLPIPKYVINRYFPKFKGYSLCSNDEVRKFLLTPSVLAARINQQSAFDKFSFDFYRLRTGENPPVVYWTLDDIRAFKIRLSHVKEYFMSELGWTSDYFDKTYPTLYANVWTSYKSFLLRMSYSMITDISEYGGFYENMDDLYNGFVHSDLLDILEDEQMILDPNQRPDIVQTSDIYEDLYWKRDKNRKVVNKAMSALQFDV